MAALTTRIGYTNLVDSASAITASSEATNFEDTKLQDDFVAVPWRTDSVIADANVVIDLGSAMAVTMVGLYGFNWTSAATVEFQGHTADSWGTPDVDETLTIETDPLSNVIPKITYFISSESKRYWRIRIQDAGNGDGYLELGRIWLGTYFQPSYNFNNGFTTQIVKPDLVSKPVLGGVYGIKYPGYEQISFEWSPGSNPLPTTDRETLEAIYLTKGMTEPIVICHDALNEPSKTGLYGYFTNETVVRRHGVTTNYGLEGLGFREDVGWNSL